MPSWAVLQDPHWRELLRHCAARGAYLGAGAAQMADLVRQDAPLSSHAFEGLQDFQEGSSEVRAGPTRLAFRNQGLLILVLPMLEAPCTAWEASS